MKFMEPFYESLIEISVAPTDWKRYVALLEAASSAGDDHAKYALSSVCLHGLGDLETPRDIARGLKLLRDASRSIHLAMTELATIYESGDFGVKPSSRKAKELFERAAEYGSIAARYHLGRCFYYGVGTPVNRRKAARLFGEAAKLGFPVYEDHGATDAGEG